MLRNNIDEKYYDLSIYELDLRPRIVTVLRRNGISNIGELLHLDIKDLNQMKGIGDLARANIFDKISSFVPPEERVYVPMKGGFEYPQVSEGDVYNKDSFAYSNMSYLCEKNDISKEDLRTILKLSKERFYTGINGYTTAHKIAEYFNVNLEEFVFDNLSFPDEYKDLGTFVKRRRWFFDKEVQRTGFENDWIRVDSMDDEVMHFWSGHGIPYKRIFFKKTTQFGKSYVFGIINERNLSYDNGYSCVPDQTLMYGYTYINGQEGSICMNGTGETIIYFFNELLKRKQIDINKWDTYSEHKDKEKISGTITVPVLTREDLQTAFKELMYEKFFKMGDDIFGTDIEKWILEHERLKQERERERIIEQQRQENLAIEKRKKAIKQLEVLKGEKNVTFGLEPKLILTYEDIMDMYNWLNKLYSMYTVLANDATYKIDTVYYFNTNFLSTLWNTQLAKDRKYKDRVLEYIKKCDIENEYNFASFQTVCTDENMLLVVIYCFSLIRNGEDFVEIIQSSLLNTYNQVKRWYDEAYLFYCYYNNLSYEGSEKFIFALMKGIDDGSVLVEPDKSEIDTQFILDNSRHTWNAFWEKLDDSIILGILNEIIPKIKVLFQMYNFDFNILLRGTLKQVIHPTDKRYYPYWHLLKQNKFVRFSGKDYCFDGENIVEYGIGWDIEPFHVCKYIYQSVEAALMRKAKYRKVSSPCYQGQKDELTDSFYMKMIKSGVLRTSVYSYVNDYIEKNRVEFPTFEYKN